MITQAPIIATARERGIWKTFGKVVSIERSRGVQLVSSMHKETCRVKSISIGQSGCSKAGRNLPNHHIMKIGTRLGGDRE